MCMIMKTDQDMSGYVHQTATEPDTSAYLRLVMLDTRRQVCKAHGEWLE